MKINDNGVVREMTPEEIEALEQRRAAFRPPEPTEDQRRIAALEMQMLRMRGGDV